jgi:hypothetical protein
MSRLAGVAVPAKNDGVRGCGGSAVAGLGAWTRSQPLGLSLAGAVAAACSRQSDEAPERAQQGQVRVLSGGATL